MLISCSGGTHRQHHRETTSRQGRRPRSSSWRGGMAPKYCNNTAAAVEFMNSIGLGNVHYLDLTASSTGANASYMGVSAQLRFHRLSP